MPPALTEGSRNRDFSSILQAIKGAALGNESHVTAGHSQRYVYINFLHFFNALFCLLASLRTKQDIHDSLLGVWESYSKKPKGLLYNLIANFGRYSFAGPELGAGTSSVQVGGERQ